MADKQINMANYILENHSGEEDGRYNISLTQLWGRNMLKGSKIRNVKDFFLSYCQEVQELQSLALEDKRTNFMATAESISSGASPLVIFFNFKMKMVETIVDSRIILGLLYYIHDLMTQTYDIDADDLTAFVCQSFLRKEKDNMMFQSLRIQYPLVAGQVSSFNENIIKPLRDKFFELMHILRMNNTLAIEDAIPPMGPYIPLYGSTYSVNECPAFALTEDDGYSTTFFNMRPVMESFKIEHLNQDFHFGDYTDVMVDDEIFIDRLPLPILSHAMDMSNLETDIRENYLFYLPIILSNANIPYRRCQPLEGDGMDGLSDILDTSPSQTELDDSREKTPVQIFIDMMAIINPYRKKQKYFWNLMTRVIHGFSSQNMVLPRGKKYVTFWEEHSYQDFVPLCNEEQFQTTLKNYPDHRAIAYYARMDDYASYEIWHQNWYESDLSAAVSNSNNHLSIARFIYKILWLDVLYDPANRNWYIYKGCRLIRDDDDTRIKKLIQDEVIPIIHIRLDLRNEERHQAVKANDLSLRKTLDAEIAMIEGLLKRMSSFPFQNTILGGMKTNFADYHFENMENMSMCLHACLNGVIEVVDETTIVFREGNILDYCTKNTGIKFPVSIKPTDPRITKVMDYFTRVFRDPETCRWILNDIPKFLYRGNADKKFRNIIGHHDSSKSQLGLLLFRAFGEGSDGYCVSLPNSTITTDNGKDDGGANPALLQATGASIAIINETSDSRDIDATKIKKFTTNDPYYVRGLYSRGGTKEMTFKLIHISNHMAKITGGADQAYRVREIYIPMLSQFVDLDKAPATLEEQYKQGIFPRDVNFTRNFIDPYAPVFLYMLTMMFPQSIHVNVNHIPRQIKEYIELQQTKTDPFACFIKYKIHVHEDNGILDTTKVVGYNDLYVTFKSWFQSNYPSSARNIPNFEIFITQVKDRWLRKHDDEEARCMKGVTIRKN